MSNIIQQLRYWAIRKPEKVAIEQDDIRISYAHLFRLVLASRNYLERALDRDRNGIAVISMRSPADAFVTILAARWLGYDTIFIWRQNVEYLQEIKKTGRLKTIIVSAAEEHTRASFPGADISGIKMQIPADIYTISNLRRLNVDADVATSPIGNHIVYTSGSTGTLKLIGYNASYENEKANSLNKLLRVVGNSRIDNQMNSLSAGIGWTNYISSIYAGCTLLNYSGNWVRNAFQRSLATHILVYPTRVDELINAIGRSEIKKNNKICCMIGGGFVSSEKLKKIRDALTDDLRFQMGTTEGGVCLYSKFQHDEDAMWLKIRSGFQVEIIKADGDLAAIGEEGELRVKVGPHAPDRYLFNEELTAERFRNGWFYTGDLAVQRADGRIRVLGRISELIAYPGGKLSSDLVEAEIGAHLQRSNVFVFSHQNERFEDEVVVCLEGPAEATQDDIQWLREKFGSLSSLVVRSVERFPALPNGKVDRLALRKLILGDLEQPALRLPLSQKNADPTP